MIYFTSDLHLYHDNAIIHNKRPYVNTEEMNDRLIKNFNARVDNNDEVYILGDITLKGASLANEIISSLNGRKHFIKGNHDRFISRESFDKTLFVSIGDYAELKYNDKFFVLSHYPFLEWNGFFRGAIHLHGHQHNKAGYNILNKKNGILRYDVGVDANNMAPVSVEEIISFFEG